MNFVLNEKLKVVITTLHHKSHFESDFSLEKGCLETLRLKEKDTVHIPWMNEMSDHQRSLLEIKRDTTSVDYSSLSWELRTKE